MPTPVIYDCDNTDKADNFGRLRDTPDFTNMQDYLYDTPVGLDAPSAWAQPGGYGENMQFIDVELCWTEDHEDFKQRVGPKRQCSSRSE